MTVDVVYEGMTLAQGVNARPEAGGLFVDFETPMPVGTRLELVTSDGAKLGRVESVVEGMGAGMQVGFGAAKPKPKAAEPNAPMAEIHSAPAQAEKESEKEEPDEPEPDDNGRKRRSRRGRKTVIGH
jgi:hypothetical protein